MAAGGLYTLGGSFWEFGEPDWDHTQYLMLWGVAEDHDSNPIKLGLGKLKARGAKIVAVNPVRTGYGAIADEWIGIRPGTDGLFAFALIHELLRMDRIDLDYLVRYANAHWLVVRNPGGADDGLFARDVDGNVLCWAVAPPPATAGEGAQARADAIDISPAVVGEYTLADGRKAVPVFQLIAERYLDPQYAPEAVSEQCGIPTDTIARIARELAQAAFDSKLTLPIAWTDAWGREHAEMVGRPVSMHAMRGISAHSTKAGPGCQPIADRYPDPTDAPKAVSEKCGIPTDTRARIAREPAQAAFDSKLTLPIACTDAWGREHAEMVGRPVSMHAMRGISAHSNGFHTCRALHLLQLLLGAVDAPGSFRYQPPYPKPLPLPHRPGNAHRPDAPLDAGPLGFITAPEDLPLDEHRTPPPTH